MGKGGGSQQPTSTTAYQTNLPEYAKPYVMNMLGAAQNQLFTTTPGANGEPGEITGFKPYTPYSTDPTKYFAAPTGLQQQVYGEAAGMQTPGAYGAAQGLTGLAAMGQMGAGQRYAQQATNPYAVQAYMSPYMQNVVDVQKANAVRDYQKGIPALRQQASAAGAFGGSRQAIQESEAQRSLLANLANIQAQGSQNAFQNAQQAQQFGANLGLQGLQGAASSAAGLGQLAGAQQQADLARMGFQQQTGAAQQQYQQNIINQAIQDYATAQQYPYMQLSTMSNLLRGLPMQSMSTQQYQAQPSSTQQLLGLAGTGASLYGAFGKKEGGEIKSYKSGGIAENMRAKLETMADTDPQGLKKLVASSSSKEVRDMGNEILSGIAMANTGKLGTNLAGGGIIAFEKGGDVPRFDGEYGSMVEDPMGLQNNAPSGYGFSVSSIGDVLGALGTEEEWQKALRLKRHGIEYTPPKGFDKEGLPIGSKFSKEKPVSGTDSDYQAFDAATAEFEKDRAKKGLTGAPVAGTPSAGTQTKVGGESPSGLQSYLDQRKKLLGFEGPGAKSEALMKALEERQAGLEKSADSDRYLRAAEAFAKFGSTAGPMLKGASEALGGFAKGESAARKEQDKIKLEGMKMQSDLEKAQRAEARGDLDKAEEFYNKAEDRKNRIETAQISAAATGQATRFEKEAVERVMAEKGVDFATALQMVRGAGRADSVEMQIATKAYTAAQASVAPGGANSKVYRELLKKDPSGAEAQKFVDDLAKQQIQGIRTTMGLGSSGGASGGKPSVTNW